MLLVSEQPCYVEAVVTCDAAVRLDIEDYLLLAALPEPANDLEHELTCEFEPHHEGRHCSLGQAVLVPPEATYWFVYWGDDGSVEITAQELCPAEAWFGDEDLEPCGLPVGHPGKHGFD